MESFKSRRTENLVYLTMWIFTIGLYLLDVVHTNEDSLKSLFNWQGATKMFRTLLPLILLFVINNYVLIPKFLLRNKLLVYFFTTAGILLVMWGYQYHVFMHYLYNLRNTIPPNLSTFLPHFLLPLPLLLYLTYSLLIVGSNIAVALLFQRYDDRLKQESLTKANAENELAYLKAQINPHFYMNMLNNIHAMIEIDPEKAQSMVIDMSKLMRYMIYDSSQTRIPLANEIAFLENYMRTMRQRYPSNRVKIRCEFPPKSESARIEVPPLLSLVFIENAFKHGISYRSQSFIDVKMQLTDNRMLFSCINSRHQDSERSKATGIGLRNVRQRLALIYGEEAALQIVETETEYKVNLSIPI